MGKRELIALLNLSSWCLVMVERLFLTVPRGCLQFVIVVFPDHTHLLFLDESTLHSLMVKHSCGINKKHVFLALQLIGYQNTIFGVVMLNHIYLPFALS